MYFLGRILQIWACGAGFFFIVCIRKEMEMFVTSWSHLTLEGAEIS